MMVEIHAGGHGGRSTLAADAALARRTAATGRARAVRLHAEALELQRQFETHAVLLRRWVTNGRARPRIQEALDRLDKALPEPEDRQVAVGPWGIRARLPRDTTCGAVARRLLAEYSIAHLGQDPGEDVLLVATELATNAVIHGEGSITLQVERRGDRLRVEVFDQGESPLFGPGFPSASALGGRGLWIVDELSLAWGTGGGHVWAEVRIA
jgi:Histidine kinase-like ATPase domain